MGGLVVAGKVERPEGLDCLSWHDDPRLRLRAGHSCRPRGERWIRGIILHTTRGIPGGKDQRPQVLRPGLGPRVAAGLRCVRYWTTSEHPAGAHLIVDADGQVVCCADLAADAAFHAGAANGITIGIEIFQSSTAELWEGQLRAVVRLVDWLTARFSIQRQMPSRYNRGPSARLVATNGADFCGVYGHRDISNNRGAGDPGDFIFAALAQARYERFELEGRTDQIAWRSRQRQLKVPETGIPDKTTQAALARGGWLHGVWVARPGDDQPLDRGLTS